MIFRTLCALLALCGALSASANPLALTPFEMDSVVAGASGVLSQAGATGDYALTQTTGVAGTAAFNPTGSLGSVAYVAGSEGVATAIGLGSGGSTSASVLNTASVPGTMVANFSVSHHLAVNGFEVAGGAAMSFGSFNKPLF